MEELWVVTRTVKWNFLKERNFAFGCSHNSVNCIEFEELQITDTESDFSSDHLELLIDAIQDKLDLTATDVVDTEFN